MNHPESLFIQQTLAYLTAIFLYQKKRNLKFELPLGMSIDFQENKQKYKLSTQAARIVKNTLETHYYSNEIKIDKPHYEIRTFNKLCKSANQYDIDELFISVGSKVMEHIGKDVDLDQSSVVYLMHKAFHTEMPASARELLTNLTSTIIYILAKKREIELPYQVKLKLSKERNQYYLNILV